MRYIENAFKERIGYDFYCDIANNIVKARKIKNMTQSELAEKIGVTVSRLSGFENVQKRISLDLLEKISEVLGVTVNWLIDAEIDSQIGDCLYTISNENDEGNKLLTLYQKATSRRMAFMLFDARLKKCGVGYGARERFIVTLVGVPITEEQLKDCFVKREEEDIPIEE